MATLLDHFESRFENLHRRSHGLIQNCPAHLLFERPKRLHYFPSHFSCAEYIIRSAANVEMAFGGITRRLWDDPFEWTLAEAVGSHETIFRYLSEVEDMTSQGFKFIGDDTALLREIPAPTELRPIIDVILESLCTAEHLQGRAFALFQVLSDEPPPRL
ncbi:MAG: hypothetical protein IPM21_16085 [Acidobacteria bacterium]|nr:hypothetical protein [Acidobacteriota bacterium]